MPIAEMKIQIQTPKYSNKTVLTVCCSQNRQNKAINEPT